MTQEKNRKKNNEIISLTQFIDFVNKKGTRKLSHVNSILHSKPYHPAFDYWKPLREALIEYHIGNKDKSYLDEIIDKVVDEKKLKNYPASIVEYKRFLGKKSIEWFEPPQRIYAIEELKIRINPELGLKFKGQSHIVKLYFKNEKLTRQESDLILLLMQQAIDPENNSGYTFSILEITRGKLHSREVDISIMPLLSGEAKSFKTIWDKLSK